ncbi:MAG: hypothetical protein IRZ16_01805 [Myxococcaceae bacterium]|nr:hypothetical protein [Myxococcaceae bacterium]
MVITSRLQELLGECGPGDFTFATDTGEGYFGKNANYGFYQNVSGKFSWAVDRGSNFTIFMRGQPPCPPVMPMARGVSSTLRSTDSNDDTDQHQWSPRSGVTDNEPPNRRHDLLACVGVDCPGMWPMFVDYNGIRVVLADDNYGQPRLFATLQRDYARRGRSPDPWNLLFRFRFRPTGPGEQYDPRGIVLRSANGGGLDISKQTAVSTAITYYHRGSDVGLFGAHWREPPNFLNPFWRATLVPSTVEGSSMMYEGGGDDDIRKVLQGANVGWAAEAHEALARAGFQGWQ